MDFRVHMGSDSGRRTLFIIVWPSTILHDNTKVSSVLLLGQSAAFRDKYVIRHNLYDFVLIMVTTVGHPLHRSHRSHRLESSCLLDLSIPKTPVPPILTLTLGFLLDGM